MVEENEEREKELFPSYNPLTGEGAPGERRAIHIPDLYHGVAGTLYLPREMWSVGLTCHLARLGSIEALGRWLYRGDWDEERRDTILRSFLRCWAKYDIYFFCYAYARIQNKEGGNDIPFMLRPAQIKLVKRLERMRLAGKPIRLILLKARQWGGSTLVQIYMAWLQLFWMKSWNSVIVGHQSYSAEQVKSMYIRLITQLPDFLLMEDGEPYDEDQPKTKGGGTQNVTVIPARRCEIVTSSALNPEGPRSGNTALAHCTEVAFWPQTEKYDPRKLIKSTTSSILAKPYTMIVYESTANGQNFFKDEWDRACRLDEHGEKESAFEPLFVAWYEIEMYRIDPPDLEEWAYTLVTRRTDKQNHWDYLYWLWTQGATLEGVYWYREKMREYQNIEDMQQEFPSNAVEAFKYSGQNEFDLYKVEQMMRLCRKPLLQGEIAGKAPKGKMAMEGVKVYALAGGALRIWEMPAKDRTLAWRYIVTVDIGGAYKTSDYSVITVLDREDMMLDDDGTLNEEAGPRVVAEWRGHTDPDLLAIKSAQIAHLYQDALLIVENNTAYSRMNNIDTENMRDLFFPVLLPLYDNIYCSRKYSAVDKEGVQNMKWGYHTGAENKTAMIKYMGQCIRDGLYLERSREALQECTYFMKYPNGKYGAIPGKHDDCVMSRAIGLYVSRWEWDRFPVRRKPSQEERMRRRKAMQKSQQGAEMILMNAKG
jgi:hypothetical protein